MDLKKHSNEEIGDDEYPPYLDVLDLIIEFISLDLDSYSAIETDYSAIKCRI